jgi:hypothetical protein
MRTVLSIRMSLVGWGIRSHANFFCVAANSALATEATRQVIVLLKHAIGPLMAIFPPTNKSTELNQTNIELPMEQHNKTLHPT